jgi:MscS family membrane protein
LLFSALSAWAQLPAPAARLSSAMVRSGLVFAFFWGSWRSVGVVIAWTMLRPWAASNPSARNLLAVGSNVFRGTIAGLGILAMLAAIGYPVGTVLAGLGIGGLALAFGAQKTVENVFGSVSLAIDQPFRVGDFVRVEDFVGTVEDIGLRSTRFRTLDRTVVSIPNGKLADQRLESLQLRDRMRLATTLGVTYSTTRSQMQAVLAGLEAALRAHPKIWPDAVVVKFKEFGASSLDIEVMAWFQVPTWGDFQVCREEILLEFMRVVEENGAEFAVPTRTLLVEQEGAGQTAEGQG